jgi:hypothetical protein
LWNKYLRWDRTTKNILGALFPNRGFEQLLPELQGDQKENKSRVLKWKHFENNMLNHQNMSLMFCPVAYHLRSDGGILNTLLLELLLTYYLRKKHTSIQGIPELAPQRKKESSISAIGVFCKKNVKVIIICLIIG